MRVDRASIVAGLLASLPIVLRLLFLAYPLVAQVAFQAFACEQFGPGNAYLRADYTIRCSSHEHMSVKIVAVLGIGLYPVGIPLCFALLLFRARHAIQGAQPTPLSKALAFLHSDYQPRFFAWELVEVLRRLRESRSQPAAQKERRNAATRRTNTRERRMRTQGSKRRRESGHRHHNLNLEKQTEARVSRRGERRKRMIRVRC